MTHPLQKFMPHFPPMLLIDQLAEYSPENAVSKVIISPTIPFFDKIINGVPSYIGIEYMAQTIALWKGVNSQNEDPRMGFLLGTRKLNLYQPTFLNGMTLTISVDMQCYVDQLASFKCKILHGDTIISDALVNVFQPDEDFIKK